MIKKVITWDDVVADGSTISFSIGETVSFNVLEAIKTKEVKIQQKPYDRQKAMGQRMLDQQKKEYEQYMAWREEKRKKQLEYEKTQARYYYPGDGSRWSDIR